MMSARVAPEMPATNAESVANSVLSGPSDVPIDVQGNLTQVPSMSVTSSTAPVTAATAAAG